MPPPRSVASRKSRRKLGSARSTAQLRSTSAIRSSRPRSQPALRARTARSARPKAEPIATRRSQAPCASWRPRVTHLPASHTGNPETLASVRAKRIRAKRRAAELRNGRAISCVGRMTAFIALQTGCACQLQAPAAAARISRTALLGCSAAPTCAQHRRIRDRVPQAAASARARPIATRPPASAWRSKLPGPVAPRP